MPIHLTWPEIVLRLALTLFSGALIGLNREEHGHAAGLRTTSLVCLAASVAMIQANLLLNLSGKTSDSFVVLDLMRLPLGILSGMGFIGAGAILRRNELVRGITTAATLWFVTVMGLCFGGGQIGLGLITLAAGFGVLRGLKYVEVRIHQDRRATLSVVIEGKEFSADDLRSMISSQGFGIASCSITAHPQVDLQEIQFDVHWRSHPLRIEIPSVCKILACRPDVSKIEWRPDPKN